MSLTSRQPATITALIALLTAALPTPAVQEVVRGPQVEGDDLGQRVYVTWDGDRSTLNNPGADVPGLDFAQEFRGLGAGRKTETFDIRCAAVCWSGDDDADALGVLVDQAYALFAAVETALRGLVPGPAGVAPLGLPLPAQVNMVAGQLLQAPGGQRVRIPFVVHVQTRI